MKKLGIRAENIFRTLVEGINAENHARKWNAGSPTYMDACVNYVVETQYGVIISIAHYYKQNGDLMKDPDVEFLVSDGVKLPTGVYPLTFQQDGVAGGYRQYVKFVGDELRYNKAGQADLTAFCNKWMQNIKTQQQVVVPKGVK
jgi:hypothetical protein